MNDLTHEEIAQRAYHIWQHYGRPAGRDDEIWFEAERQLAEIPQESAASVTQTWGSSASSSNRADELRSETAAESMAEFHISPPVSDDAAVKAALQKKDARAPRVPGRSAPKAKPPETGKPLWDRPHSA